MHVSLQPPPNSSSSLQPDCPLEFPVSSEMLLWTIIWSLLPLCQLLPMQLKQRWDAHMLHILIKHHQPTTLLAAAEPWQGSRLSFPIIDFQTQPPGMVL